MTVFWWKPAVYDAVQCLLHEADVDDDGDDDYGVDNGDKAKLTI